MAMKRGICKLTGAPGLMAKAHIIPKALTYPDPEQVGEPFYQAQSGFHPVRRWSSWWDPNIVTTKGETVLRDLDTWAIDYLRDQRLVWSGWGESVELPHNRFAHTPWGIRKIDVPEPAKLRRFLLSILWRAAVSDMPEFSEVMMPEDDLERLRKMVLGKTEEDISFYPASLSQLSTRGIVHNHSPIAMTKPIPALGDYKGGEVPIFRFYFDGLMVHFHRQSEDSGDTAALGDLVVGASLSMSVSTVTFEHSFQLQNLVAVMSEGLPLR